MFWKKQNKERKQTTPQLILKALWDLNDFAF